MDITSVVFTPQPGGGGTRITGIMSLFANIGKPKPDLTVKIERVKGALEHVALYVGLALYTAVGAKVENHL